MKSTEQMLQDVRAAKGALAQLTIEQKNAALTAMADELIAATSSILKENALDLADAEGHISEVMMDRLRLTKERIEGMAQGIRDVVALPDPVGRVLRTTERPGGLLIKKVSVPMGVIAIIYESRPNVTSDAAALCLKSGSACVLRCGKEARRSAGAIVDAMKRGLKRCGISPDVIGFVEEPGHESAEKLMHAVGIIDLLIPRGGAGLIRTCVEKSDVPCIETGTGICHVYVDAAADLAMAAKIIDNAKTSRPSVCNAEEVCLVHKAVAAQFLPMLKARLVDERAAAGLVPVELRLDERAASIIPGTPAGEKDFDTEFLDYILAVKVVDSADEAIAHIGLHSTHHSDAVVTEDTAVAERFTLEVDSAAVYVNCSTRITDGGEFGLGCEMGISTQRIHARGPMGLEELCTYKYVIRGEGNIR